MIHHHNSETETDLLENPQSNRLQGYPSQKNYKLPILIFGLLVVIGAALVFLLLFWRPGEIESLGVLRVEGDRAYFSHEDIDVEITPGDSDTSLDTVIDLEVFRISEGNSIYEEEEGGPIYRLEGDLTSLGASNIQVSFPLEDSLIEGLNAPGEIEDHLAISLIKDTFETSEGVFHEGEPLETKFDWEENKMSAKLTIGPRADQGAESTAVVGAAAIAGTEYPAGIFETVAKQTQVSDVDSNADANQVESVESVEFQPTRYLIRWRQAESSDGHFRVIYPDDIPEDTIHALAEEMERQKLNLERLNFSFYDRSYPIDVRLREWQVGPLGIGDRELGRYTRVPFMGPDSGSIILNLSMFNRPRLDDMKSPLRGGISNWEIMTMTAGHELLHLAQHYGYENNYSAYLWLDEALSTWYELYAVSDIYQGDMRYGGVHPDAATDNLDFIFNPLYFPQDPESHGYGASMLMAYLINDLSDQYFPAKLVQQARNLAGSKAQPGNVLNQVLFEEYGRVMSTEWHGFLEDYLIYPEDEFDGVDTSELFKGNLNLLGEKLEEDYIRYDIEGENTLDDVTVEVTYPEEVHHTGAEEPLSVTLSLEFELEGLSAYPFKISLDEIAKSEPVDMEIELQGEGAESQYMSMQVYGVPVGGQKPEILAGSEEALFPYEGDEHLKLQDNWDSLYFIVLNSDDEPFTKEAKNMGVELTFGPTEGKELTLQMINPYDSSRGSKALTMQPGENGTPVINEVSWGSPYGLLARIGHIPREVEKVRLEWDFGGTRFESAHGFHGTFIEKDVETVPIEFETYGRFFQPGLNRIGVTLYDATDTPRGNIIDTTSLKFYLAHINSVTEVETGRNISQWSRNAALPGESIEFDALPREGDYLYRWDFGDGTVSTKTEGKVSHRYTEPGRYVITFQLLSPESENQGEETVLASSGRRIILVEGDELETEQEVETEKKIPAHEDDIVGVWFVQPELDWSDSSRMVTAHDSILVIKKDEERGYFPSTIGVSDEERWKMFDEHPDENAYEITSTSIWASLVVGPYNKQIIQGQLSEDGSVLRGDFTGKHITHGVVAEGTFRATKTLMGQVMEDSQQVSFYECQQCGAIYQRGTQEYPCPNCSSTDWEPFQ